MSQNPVECFWKLQLPEVYTLALTSLAQIQVSPYEGVMVSTMTVSYIAWVLSPFSEIWAKLQ